MNWFKQIVSRRKMTGDLSEEMQQHLDEKIEALVASGMPREEAVHAARRAFGNATLLEQRSREVWMWPWIESLWADVKFALRQLRKSPGFTATVILTLALGIGANTAIFSLTYAILLQSLPVANPNRLVRYTFSNGSSDFGLSGPSYDELRRRVTVANLMAWGSEVFTRTSKGQVKEIHGALMSGNGFAVLQLQPALGRSFGEQDDVLGGGPHGYQALLGYDYWKNAFQANPNVLGRTLTINGRAVTVIGVLPRQFGSVNRGGTADLVLPLAFDEVLHPRHPRRHAPNYLWLTVLGRLRTGQSLQAAKSNLAAIAPQVRKAADPTHIFLDGFFKPFQYGVVDGRMGSSNLATTYRQPLLVLELLAGLLLALCCVNLALLLLARSSARSHEFAVRSALGASRATLFGHVLLEVLLLGCAGMLAGLLLGWLLAHSLVALLADGATAVRIDVAPNLVVFGCATAAALLTALVAGLFPAILASRTMPAMDLKQAQTTTKKISGTWIVSIQIALSLVLTASAFWLGSTFLHLFLKNSGFQPKHVVFAEFHAWDTKIPPAQVAQQKLEILARLEHTPGIQAATWMTVPPLDRWWASSSYIARDRHGAVHLDMEIWPEGVNADYFAALGTRILEGRNFIQQDKGAGAACILSASAAAKFFPGEDALGKTIYSASGDSPQEMAKSFDAKNACRVIGVAQDAHFSSLKTAPQRTVYQLARPDKPIGFGMTLVVRAADTASAIREIRSIAHNVSPTSAAPETRLFTEMVDASLRQERLLVRLSLGFSALALLLTGVGLFGILARRVTERTREIGIRMAFGAPRSAVLRMVLFSTAVQVCAGIVLGMACTVFMGRAMHGLLYGTNAGSLWIYLASVAAIMLICMLAVFIPARRAVSVDPMQALRAE
ncbi:MAG: ADOP family duplicated permease [Acidobacteriaceae bacterium]